MAIPRLPPATTPISVSLEVNAVLRPYFTEFYKAKKEAGESPEQFLLRYMKDAVRDYWLTYSQDQIVEAAMTERRDMHADSDTFNTEIS